MTTRDAHTDSSIGRKNDPYIGARINKYFAGRTFQSWTTSWATEALRVLKPGGHLLSFGGTRTYHRMACGVEDAGFEIRDCILWIYGSGFPKSLDIGKQIAKNMGEDVKIGGAFVVAGEYGGRNLRNPEHQHDREFYKHKPQTPEAKFWDGWGTALKPACEPIVVARKPIEGTVASNVLKWGTGGINVDGCRVEAEEELRRTVGGFAANSEIYHNDEKYKINTMETNTPKGRFPANVIHDGSDEVLALFPESEGCKPHIINASDETEQLNKEKGWGSISVPKNKFAGFNDSGSAARFFYTAKASREERDEGLDGFPISNGNRDKAALTHAENRQGYVRNTHPTVKPLDLMKYLIKLVTREGQVVLDPFVGSGSTCVAARLLNRHYIGIDKEPEYVKIAEARLRNIPPPLEAFG